MQAVLDESAELLRAERGRSSARPATASCARTPGVDHSNTGGAGELVLLPEDPDALGRAR